MRTQLLQPELSAPIYFDTSSLGEEAYDNNCNEHRHHRQIGFGLFLGFWAFGLARAVRAGSFMSRDAPNRTCTVIQKITTKLKTQYIKVSNKHGIIKYQSILRIQHFIRMKSDWGYSF